MTSNSSLRKDSGKDDLSSKDVESLKLDETKDNDLMDVDCSDTEQLSNEPLESNEDSENNTDNKVLFGEDHMKGRTSSNIFDSIVYSSVYFIIFCFIVF